MTGCVVATLPKQTPEEVDAAVARAVKAQKIWAAWAPERRSECLWAWGILIERDFEQIARMDTQCTGKVLRDAFAETKRASRHAKYWAGMTDKLHGDQLCEPSGRMSYTRREPLGAFAVVLPWNAPAHSFMARSVPPLACGNAVIVKPSELSPLSALRLAELALEAGLPEGVLQVIVGDGATGALLVGHDAIRGISFTGSPATGRRILKSAAETFKKVTLEMGGKSPIIVFPDADLDSAARAAAMGIAVNAGQICAASSRLVVHRDIADAFIEDVKDRLGKIVVGDPFDAATQVGPIVCARQFEQVMAFISRGLQEGGRLLMGGGRPKGLENDPGLYVAPTLIDTDNVPTHIAREEVFGPVLAISRFSDDEHALAIANETQYGLSAFVWTSDVGRMLRMAEAVEAGVVHGNSTLVLDSGLPFGGFKNSGLGGAFGADAIEGCTQTKRITLRTARGPLPEVWSGV